MSAGSYHAILALGDEQYDVGAPDAFTAFYGPNWGVPSLKPITWPAPGNHEYYTGGATGYFNYFQTAAGDPTKGYYDFFDTNVAPHWHFIALNAVCANDDPTRPYPNPQPPACDATSQQVVWLGSVLAANPNMCTLAYWHHPRWSSSLDHDDNPLVSFWPTLYQYKVDIVLNGHAHDYERFLKMNDVGVAASDGMAEFIVGTGGESHAGPFTETPRPTSVVRNRTDLES